MTRLRLPLVAAPLLAAALLVACAPASPRTLYVEPPPDGEWDDPAGMALVSGFGTIGDAIAAASPGDTVAVPAGTYFENLFMADGVHIVGAGQGQTTVVGNANFMGITGASLGSLTMVAGSWYSGSPTWNSYGVECDEESNITVYDVELSGWEHAVFAQGATYVHVTASNLVSNSNGVFIEYSDGVEIANNFFASNLTSGVSWADTSPAAVVVHNTFVGNGFVNPEGISDPAAVQIDDPGGQEIYNNIMTGNFAGLNCDGCTAAWGYNDVWGNVTDYAGSASPHVTDLSVDPGFADAPEGDYHLAATSPLIDVGTGDSSHSYDIDGDVRPFGEEVDIGMDEFVVSSVSLLLSEVMANPAVEGTGEYVEVLNTGAAPVDLAGLVLSDGAQHDALVPFDGGVTTVAPGARAVIVDPEYAGQYSIGAGVTLLTTDDTTLGNGLTTADPITLYEADAATVVATFSYPSDPGEGVSLELSDAGAGDVAGNWLASQCPDGRSPGAGPCFPDAGDPGALVITEVLANALDEGSGEYVEVWNSGVEPVDGAGLVLEDGGGHSDVLLALGGGVALIDPGEHALIVDPDWPFDAFVPPGTVLLTAPDSTLGNGLSVSDSVTLFAPDGTTVIDAFSFPEDPGDGHSVEKIDYAAGDLASNWQAATDACTTGSSPGRLNGSAGGRCGPVVVNEVMSNPLSEATGEYVELWNTGLDDVDLAGLVLSDGDAAEALVPFDGGPTVLAAGGYAVVVDSGFEADYAVAADAVLLTSADATLGNALSTTDPIALYEADGVTLIDSFGYPFNPGNGTAAERVEVDGADSASNWVASPCSAGGSPGFANCATTGEAGGGDSDLDVVITEVMSNPVVESTGEYVELYNDGPDPVDLAGFELWDGDATDPLEGLLDPTDTVLEPGAWAVILDSQYDGAYAIDADALLLTTDDAAIASGLALDDELVLFEPDGTTVVSTFSWPMNAGDGNSIERLDLGQGDEEANWGAAACGPTPGAANCP